MSPGPAIDVDHLWHRYAERAAIKDLSLDVARGEIFAFLGPNGGGKTTLFRVLSTLLPPQQGHVRIFGEDVQSRRVEVRSVIGVVFQAASLDKKLTVSENLRHQAALYGLSREITRTREVELLAHLGLSDRAGDMTEILSGGLRRRVELAKGMMHRPELLLMDEPSTGLNPGARSDLWQYLRRLRDQFGVTIVLTTHLLEEADKVDRIGILHEGELVALDSPAALRTSVGAGSLTVTTAEPDRLAVAMNEQFGCHSKVIDGSVRLEQADAGHWVGRLMQAFPDAIDTITVGKPTLEDVFIQKTGHRFWQEQPLESPR